MLCQRFDEQLLPSIERLCHRPTLPSRAGYGRTAAAARRLSAALTALARPRWIETCERRSPAHHEMKFWPRWGMISIRASGGSFGSRR